MIDSTGPNFLKMRVFGLSYNKSDFFGTRMIDFEFLEDYIYFTVKNTISATGWLTAPEFTPNTVGGVG